jgi:hypothetical protein
MRTRGRSINNRESRLSGHFLIVGNGAEGKNQMEDFTTQSKDNGPLKRMRPTLSVEIESDIESGGQLRQGIRFSQKNRGV